jgi:hypothetical protein
MEANGLSVFNELGVVFPNSTVYTSNESLQEALATSLQIASHLIRNSEQYLDQIVEIIIPRKLCLILAMV